jgi:putative nucleotidyltransferase with HDIG domain
MSSHAAAVRAPDGVRLGRYLPLSALVTLAVTLLPLAAVALLGPARSPLAVALHVLAAVALSIAIARALAAVWTRHGRSSDVVFGDLLLWGWARRVLAERRLEATAEQLTGRQAADRVALLQRMSALLEARDPYTHGHSRRVARHSERIARQMGLPRELIEEIRAAALVHDVGKINVPRSILNKPGKLSEREFALIKRHAADGAAMVAELGDAELTAIVRHHHERLDGTGYPDGLAGDDIPLGARIIAVADTFDAITSTRAYRKPRSHRKALDVLQGEAGTQLDALAVAAFVSYYEAGRSIGLATVLAAAPQRLLSGLGGVQSGLGASVAQTACGVGGAALIGACLSGPALPSSPTEADAGAGQVRRVAAQPRSGEGERRSGEGERRSGERTPQPRAGLGDPSTGSAPSDRVRRPAFELPPRTVPEGGGQPEHGSGGGGGGVTPPDPPVGLPEPPVTLPDLPPVLPDPGSVLKPVTDIPLPSVQAPVPVPKVGLP